MADRDVQDSDAGVVPASAQESQQNPVEPGKTAVEEGNIEGVVPTSAQESEKNDPVESGKIAGEEGNVQAGNVEEGNVEEGNVEKGNIEAVFPSSAQESGKNDPVEPGKAAVEVGNVEKGNTEEGNISSDQEPVKGEIEKTAGIEQVNVPGTVTAQESAMIDLGLDKTAVEHVEDIKKAREDIALAYDFFSSQESSPHLKPTQEQLLAFDKCTRIMAQTLLQYNTTVDKTEKILLRIEASTPKKKDKPTLQKRVDSLARNVDMIVDALRGIQEPLAAIFDEVKKGSVQERDVLRRILQDIVDSNDRYRKALGTTEEAYQRRNYVLKKAAYRSCRIICVAPLFLATGLFDACMEGGKGAKHFGEAKKLKKHREQQMVIAQKVQTNMQHLDEMGGVLPDLLQNFAHVVAFWQGVQTRMKALRPDHELAFVSFPNNWRDLQGQLELNTEDVMQLAPISDGGCLSWMFPCRG